VKDQFKVKYILLTRKKNKSSRKCLLKLIKSLRRVCETYAVTSKYLFKLYDYSSNLEFCWQTQQERQGWQELLGLQKEGKK